MNLIEETKAWREAHLQAGRDLEVVACDLRIKILERCQSKAHKPLFVANIGFKAEENIIVYSHMSRRSDNHEHYIDDVLVNQVILQAVKDYQESRK